MLFRSLTNSAVVLPVMLGLAVTGSIFTFSGAEAPVSFSKEIGPIFENSYWKCHGPTMQLSKLDLHTREGALKGGEHGPAIVPGRAKQSRLYRLMAGLEKPATRSMRRS